MAKTVTLEDEVVRLRDKENKNWSEIAEELDIGQGKAMFLYMKVNAEPLTFKDDADLAKKVVALRTGKEPESWGLISARSGVSEGKLKKLFEEASGNPARGQRIGKGGRYPGEANGAAKATAVKKTAAKTTKAAGKTAKVAKTAAKSTKATGKKATGAKKGAANPQSSAVQPGQLTPLSDLTLEELQARLNGKVITVAMEMGGERKVAVQRVTGVTRDGELKFSDKDGKSRVVLISHILRAQR